ncbi:alpha/beta fold hydrolase [Chloroflexota bacterium]
MPHIAANGINFYYELHGSTNAPVLALNNGIIMNAASSWIFQTQALSAHFQVFQYDCRGQGQSDHPEGPYSMEMHADDLSALLQELGINSAHIAGISYGGEVAQAFALKYPRKVQSLVLVDTVSEVGEELKLVIQSWIDALNTGDPLAFFNVTVPWNFSPGFIASNIPLLEDAKKRYADLDFPAVIRLCNAFLDLNFTPQLKEIQVPTCIMVGELDLLKGPLYADILHRNISNSEIHVLKGAGHASCWESPQVFNEIILDFLGRH